MIWVVASGLYNVAFGLFHLTFWRLLKWQEQLSRLSPTNRAVVQALNLCLTFFFFVGAYLYLVHGAEIRTTGIGSALAAGMLAFWVFRTAQQLVLFDLRHRVHQILLALFVAGIVLHAAVFLA